TEAICRRRDGSRCSTAREDTGHGTAALVISRSHTEDGIINTVQRLKTVLSDAHIVASYFNVVVVLKRLPNRIGQRQRDDVAADDANARQIGKRWNWLRLYIGKVRLARLWHRRLRRRRLRAGQHVRPGRRSYRLLLSSWRRGWGGRRGWLPTPPVG